MTILQLKYKCWYYKYRITYRLHQTLIKIKLPLCRGVEEPCFRKGKRRHQNTAYADDERNYIFTCSNCLDIINEYWNERWQDYYGMCYG